MKIYFNRAFNETKRETNDLWVKFNNGNTLDAYFEGLNLKDPSITARIIIEWASGKVTNELPMLKAFDGTHLNFTMPILEESGTTKFTIRIYQNNVLMQPVIFTREIKDSLEPSDATNITPAEYQVMLEAIERNRQAILELNTNKVGKVQKEAIVYATSETANEDGTVDEKYIPYSVTPLANSIVQRGENGRAEFEDPINEKDAVNKRTYDKVVRALTYNHAGLLFVSKLDKHTGNIKVIFNSSLVRHISDVNRATGEITITARPINWECKPVEGGNK